MKLPPICQPVRRGPGSGRRSAPDSVRASQDEDLDEEDLTEDLEEQNLDISVSPAFTDVDIPLPF